MIQNDYIFYSTVTVLFLMAIFFVIAFLKQRSLALHQANLDSFRQTRYNIIKHLRESFNEELLWDKEYEKLNINQEQNYIDYIIELKTELTDAYLRIENLQKKEIRSTDYRTDNIVDAEMLRFQAMVSQLESDFSIYIRDYIRFKKDLVSNLPISGQIRIDKDSLINEGEFIDRYVTQLYEIKKLQKEINARIHNNSK